MKISFIHLSLLSAFVMLAITCLQLYAFAFALNKISIFMFLFGEIIASTLLIYVVFRQGFFFAINLQRIKNEVRNEND